MNRGKAVRYTIAGISALVLVSALALAFGISLLTVPGTHAQRNSDPSWTVDTDNEWQGGTFENTWTSENELCLKDYYDNLLDDFADGKLSSRDNYGTTSPNFPCSDDNDYLDSNPSITRPEWVVSSGTVTADNGGMLFDSSTTTPTAQADSGKVTGIWKMDFRFQSLPSTDWLIFRFIYENENNYYSAVIQYDDEVTIGKVEGGSSTYTTNKSWTLDTDSHTLKVKRKSNGDIYMYIDGDQVDSATDWTWTPSIDNFSIRQKQDADVLVDNIVVYKENISRGIWHDNYSSGNLMSVDNLVINSEGEEKAFVSLTGRKDQDNTTENSYAYFIGENKWENLEDYPIENGVNAGSYAYWENDVYLFGGATKVSGTNTFHDNVFRYDPETDTYTEKANMPFERDRTQHRVPVLKQKSLHSRRV